MGYDGINESEPCIDRIVLSNESHASLFISILSSICSLSYIPVNCSYIRHLLSHIGAVFIFALSALSIYMGNDSCFHFFCPSPSPYSAVIWPCPLNLYL